MSEQLQLQLEIDQIRKTAETPEQALDLVIKLYGAEFIAANAMIMIADQRYLLTVAAKFITELADSSESGFVRQRAAVAWLNKFNELTGKEVKISDEK